MLITSPLSLCIVQVCLCLNSIMVQDIIQNDFSKRNFVCGSHLEANPQRSFKVSQGISFWNFSVHSAVDFSLWH